MTKLEKGLLALVLWIFVCPITSIWGGFVLAKLWAWFVVTTFGLCPLSIAQAIGINIIGRYLTVVQVKSADTDALAMVGSAASFWTIYPLIALFFGYIVHLFL